MESIRFQVNAEVGLTFASGLRSILRQDPDIVMVGEFAIMKQQIGYSGGLNGGTWSSRHFTNSAAAYCRVC